MAEPMQVEVTRGQVVEALPRSWGRCRSRCDALRAVPGWAGKGGAEGLFCACSHDGLGIALKVEDGAFRAILPALAELLGRLGIETGELGIVTLENSRGEEVGTVKIRRRSGLPKSRLPV